MTQAQPLYFATPNPFDFHAAFTFGVSAKVGDNPIGQFGTGLKYATAIILRLNGSITIRTPTGATKLTAQTRTTRGQDYSIVLANESPLGFTTHLGAHWEPWQAYRELYCNTLDEGGIVTTNKAEADKYQTVIEVNAAELTHTHNNKDQWFISSAPTYETETVEFHPNIKNEPQMHFFKGIAVAVPDHSSLFTYNIKSGVDLTEDRTAAYPTIDIKQRIAREIQSSSNHNLITAVLTSRHKADYQRDYQASYTTSQAFLDIVTTLMADNQSIPLSAQSVRAYNAPKTEAWPEFSLTPIQQQQLDRAIAILPTLNISNPYPIKTVKGLGEGVMGRAYKGTIYLSELPFESGTKVVASTLLEEYVHLKYGHKDFDYQMQTWLFDKIISLGEELRGEAL